MILDDWQKEASEWEGDLLLCTGRQVGKTTLLARKSAEYLYQHPKSTIICCSLTEDQAKLIIVMTLDYLQKVYPKSVCKGTKKPTQNKIELTNGSIIRARPVGNTGDAVRGFTSNVLILDEVARFNELIMESAKPTLLTTGGKIWAASTPRGKIGFFWECYQNKNNRFKVIQVNSWDVVHKRAISSDWTERKRAEAIAFLEQELKDMTDKQFQQEYMGQFVEGLSQFFPSELIKKCMVLGGSLSPSAERPAWALSLFPGRDKFLGVDISRYGEDETALVSLLRIEREHLEMINLEVLTKKPLTETARKILELDKKYKYRKVYIDSSGVGGGCLDILLEESQTKNKVVPIENKRKSLDRDEKQKRKMFKEDLYVNLLWLMQRDKVKLFDLPEIFISLSGVQFEYNERKELLIHGEKDHIAEALVRAAWCMKDKTLSLWAA